MNWVCFPTAAVRRVHPTPARRVLQSAYSTPKLPLIHLPVDWVAEIRGIRIQRDQEIQSLPKDRCFLLQNCGNPVARHAGEEAILAAVRSDTVLATYLADQPLRKVIVVPNRLVNLV